MGTQALITYVGDDGQTLLKIVAGSDGGEYEKVVESIERQTKNGPITLDEVYETAISHLGSVVVLSRTDFRSRWAEDEEELSELYRKTFDQPRFNPRWQRGTADYVVVINKQVVL